MILKCDCAQTTIIHITNIIKKIETFTRVIRHILNELNTDLIKCTKIINCITSRLFRKIFSI